jgi:arginyl-tRNA synthetase
VRFKKQILPRFLLPYIIDRSGLYGANTSIGLRNAASPELGRKKLLVEFSSPNIASEFHGKHLRSTVIGNYIAGIHEAMGWDVIKVNYLGDWGLQIGLLGVGWEKFGSEELFQADPSGHLLDVYHKISDLLAPEQDAARKAREEKKDQSEIMGRGIFADRAAFFKRMEDGEAKALALWKRVRDVHVDSLKKLYGRLNVNFDEYSGESQASAEKMNEIEEILKGKNLLEEKNGSWVVNLKKHGSKAGAAKIRGSTGSSTYLLRDLAVLLERNQKYVFDKVIYVVATDHANHFAQLFKVLELMDMADLASKLQHIHFSDASEIAAKLGSKHMLGDILDQGKVEMQNSLEANPEQTAILGVTPDDSDRIAIAALFVQELTTKRDHKHAFDIKHMTSFEPGTGPDCLYWSARLRTIASENPNCTSPEGENGIHVMDNESFNLLRLLIQYPEVTQSAYRTLEPSAIVAYLAGITKQLSLCLQSAEEKSAPIDRMLCEATQRVLANGLKLLGIAADGN